MPPLLALWTAIRFGGFRYGTDCFSFHYLPDQSEYNKGLIAAYEISVGTGSRCGEPVVSSGEFSNIKNNPILQSVYFSPVTARYVLLKAVRMVENDGTDGLCRTRGAITMHQYTHVPVHGTATVCQWVYEYLDTWLHY